jgi:uncharacterized protein (UPF0297 family)
VEVGGGPVECERADPIYVTGYDDAIARARDIVWEIVQLYVQNQMSVNAI